VATYREALARSLSTYQSMVKIQQDSESLEHADSAEDANANVARIAELRIRAGSDLIVNDSLMDAARKAVGRSCGIDMD